MKTSDFSFLIVSTDPERSLRLLKYVEREFSGSHIIEAVSAPHALQILRPPRKNEVSSIGYPNWRKYSQCAIIIDTATIENHAALLADVARINSRLPIIELHDLSLFGKVYTPLRPAITQKGRIQSRFKKVTLSPAA